MLQRRRAHRKRGRINAMNGLSEEVNFGYDDEKGAIRAINYSYGSNTPSSADANRELRRRGPQFGMGNPQFQADPMQFRANSFIGPPRNQGGFSNPNSSGRRRRRNRGASQGRGGGRARGNRGGGGRGGRTRGRGGRGPQRRVNALPDYEDTINQIGELFGEINMMGAGPSVPDSGNSMRPRA